MLISCVNTYGYVINPEKVLAYNFEYTETNDVLLSAVFSKDTVNDKHYQIPMYRGTEIECVNVIKIINYYLSTDKYIQLDKCFIPPIDIPLHFKGLYLDECLYSHLINGVVPIIEVDRFNCVISVSIDKETDDI